VAGQPLALLRAWLARRSAPWRPAFARVQARALELREQWMRLLFNHEAFIAAVGVAQERIAAGETYQVNLSLRQSRPLPAPPERIYEALRRLTPSPYMALLRFPALVGGKDAPISID